MALLPSRRVTLAAALQSTLVSLMISFAYPAPGITFNETFLSILRIEKLKSGSRQLMATAIVHHGQRLNADVLSLT